MVWYQFGTAKTACFARKSHAVWRFGTDIHLFGTRYQIIFRRKSHTKRMFFLLFGTDVYCLVPFGTAKTACFARKSHAVWRFGTDIPFSLIKI